MHQQVYNTNAPDAVVPGATYTSNSNFAYIALSSNAASTDKCTWVQTV